MEKHRVIELYIYLYVNKFMPYAYELRLIKVDPK